MRAHAGGGQPDPGSASEEVCSPPRSTIVIQKKFVGAVRGPQLFKERDTGAVRGPDLLFTSKPSYEGEGRAGASVYTDPRADPGASAAATGAAVTVNEAAMEEWATASAAREFDSTKPGASALGGELTEDDHDHDSKKMWEKAFLFGIAIKLDHGRGERAHAGGGQPDPGSAPEEVCSPPRSTIIIQKKFVGTCIRRLTIKASAPTLPLVYANPDHRKAGRKGAGRAGA